MKYILDTNVLLWYTHDEEQLSSKIVNTIENSKNTICISTVSLWEIALKNSLHKLELKESIHELIEEVKQSTIEILDIDVDYYKKIKELPQHHKDPFDRLIIITAMEEDCIIITPDHEIHKYDVVTVWDELS